MTNCDQRADEDAIRALIDRQVKGWAAGDPAAYASVFTSDADYVTFLGSHHAGRDAIASSYVPLFKKLLKGTQLRIDIIQVRFLTADVALVHSNASVVKGTRRHNRRNSRVNTSVAVRTDGRWRLAASQNTTHRRLAEKLVAKLFS
ncbi:SgcJ/EcaC family oxidoreductase [Mycobacterium sp. 94-17]|uniref:SgcJ/EcaC family oxidoreductase n=1 Tax=Mycobacterium sp. 94-17 TaxID=2986147 RepID=UPI002D1F23E3|nr:SgcJ/EcaC family oxidoreductase [Mycobacterium sp. 94-17]MEB4209309.1 SgcJ/EcaC family oxidoreductase [Mycobacterium sp. 94-17]